jgi:hypothetical protein
MTDGRSTRWTAEQRAMASAKSTEIAAKRKAAFKIPERKICRMCQVEKLLAEFPAHPTMKDGHLNHCQDCINVAVRVRHHAKPKIKKIKPTRAERLAELPKDFMKNCAQCGVEKPLAAFHSSNLGKHGVRNKCRECMLINYRDAPDEKRIARAARNAKWRKDNPDRSRKAMQRYASKNREKRLLERKEWRRKNLEKDRKREREYLKNNRPVVYAKNARRRAAETQAVPEWLTSIQKAQIQSFYEIALACEMQTGVKHHVDHIVPLRGNGVNGLHVPWNLQVLTEFENCSKHNRLIDGGI